MDKRDKNSEKIAITFWCGMLFVLFCVVLIKVPYNGAPDEHMRYQIAQYVYQHMKLPRGDEPEILNEIWGISYAFTPINSYIISGLIMKIVSLMGVHVKNLFYYARIVSVLFSMGTAAFCLKIGKKLFKGIYVWLFVILVTLLPEFIFISGYINCDAIAIFSVAWIIYAMLYGKEQRWNTKSCLFLGVGLGFCALSYYNAYGIILFAVIYCLLSVIFDKQIENKVKFLLKKTGWTFVAAFLVAGWWFIRNAILYNGDILGLAASSACAELNALEEFKPSNRLTPFKMGYSLKYMLHDMQWIRSSLNSFVAAFGYMQYFIKDYFYDLYYYIIGIGLIVKGTELLSRLLKKRKTENRDDKNDFKQGIDSKIFWCCMIATCIVTIGISIYYSYFNDFQAQGRYCLPMLIPMALLVTSGYEYIGKKVNVIFGKVLAYMASMYMFIIAFYSIFCVLAAQY